jgi:Heterokaryon incompatibility protein (HET)
VVPASPPKLYSGYGSLELEKGVFWEETSVQTLSFGFHCPVADRSGMLPFSWEISFRMYPELKPAKVTDWKSMEASPVYDSTSGESALMQIRSWLQTCLESHTSCQRVQITEWLPTRLIEVCGNENNAAIRLRLGSDLQPGTRYLALSHCWGQRKAIKLTSNTYNEFVAGMSLNRLPKTFRHAVDITKRLGYAFLWIDSL